MFGKKTGFGTVGSIRHIAGMYAQRSDDISGAFLFQRRSSRLKFDREIALPAGECGRRGAKINTLVNGKICIGIDVVLFEDIFKYHFRHTAASSAQYIGSF